MNILRRGVVLKLANDMVVVILDRSSNKGWNCLCVQDARKPSYNYTHMDIFVFDEDLKEARPVCFATVFGVDVGTDTTPKEML